ncbi:MAG: glycosyltransferase [Culicoidibacterales bacterium]
MKKILIMAKQVDTLSGEDKMTIELANEFVNRGYEVGLLCANHIVGNTPILPIDKRIKYHKIYENSGSLPIEASKLIWFSFLTRLEQKSLQTFIQYFSGATVIIANPIMLKCYSKYQSLLGKSYCQFHSSLPILENHPILSRYVKRYGLNVNQFLLLSERDKFDFKKIYGYDAQVMHNYIQYEQQLDKELETYKKIIYIGGFAKLKRVPLIIKLFVESLKCSEDKSWELHLYGDGPQKKLVELAVNQANNVTYHGRTKNPLEELAKADVLIMASTIEGLPLSIIEAKSQGVPTIAYNCSYGMEELIHHQVDGILVPQDDEAQFIKELSNLMNDDDNLQDMKKSAKRDFSRFTKAIVMEQWENLINQ